MTQEVELKKTKARFSKALRPRCKKSRFWTERGL